MSAPTADRNLLFGVVALQMDFISRDALIAAMNAWALEKTKPLGAILVDRGDLPEPRRSLLESLVDEHVRQHGGDPARSLAMLSSVDSTREAMAGIDDPDLQASLGHLAADRSGFDPHATSSRPASAPTEEDPSATISHLGPPTSVLSRFRILRPHAKGGLGAVYVALDGELNRRVALKQIQERLADHPDSRARFLLEAEVTGGLEHPGIVPVYSLGHDPTGRPYYAMRFIEGDSLKQAIARFHAADTDREPGHRTLELQKLLRRFLDVCEAIAYAHSRGVLHRDLKPGNIMVGKYGETLVVDWGLAKLVAAPDGTEERALRLSSSGSSETLPGSAVGTPSYMSPEQADGRLDQLGPASDVYSLGATLYALLTGRSPVDDTDLPIVLDRVRRGDFPPPRQVQPDVPAPLEAICLKAMALDPADRYTTPQALAGDLEAYLADEPVSAWHDPFSARARRWARRRPRLVASSAATLATGFLTLAALAVVITASNRRLDAANTKLTNANTQIRDQNARITTQNQQLEQTNSDLDLARAEAVQKRDQAEAVTDFLVRSFRSPDPALDGLTITIAEVLQRAVEELPRRDDLAPATRATILKAIADSYRGLGLVHRAVEVHEAALELHSQVLGEDHPDTLTLRSALAAAYVHAGRLDEAIPLLEAALEAQRAVLGEDHPDTLTTRSNLAMAYGNAGRVDEAIPLLEAALASYRSALGDDHPNTMISSNNLAECYRDVGRLDEAIPLFEQAVRGFVAAMGDRHPTSITLRSNLIRAYEDTGRLGDAESIRRDLLAEAGARKPRDDSDYAEALASLGTNLLALRRPDEAEPILRECLELRERLAPDHWTTADSRSLLGEALAGLGRFDEAEPLLLDGRRDLEEQADAIPVEFRELRRREAVERPVRLYESWGKPEEEARWLREVAALRAEPALPGDVFEGPDGPGVVEGGAEVEAAPAVPGP